MPTTASRDEIIAYADDLLEIGAFADYCPNGLQVPGADRVSRVVSGVSAHRELIERAVENEGELLIVHHGLFWSKAPVALSEAMAARLRVAFDADLNIAGYHLPLDAHLGIGNNALLCERLGFERVATFAAAGGRDIGVVGSIADGIDARELVVRISGLLDREPLVLGAGPSTVRTMGIVSGGGAPYLAEAIGLGLDAMLTGEPAEQATAESREGSIHLIAAGHHATERFGIAALGELIAATFGVEHRFIEVPNPV